MYYDQITKVYRNVFSFKLKWWRTFIVLLVKRERVLRLTTVTDWLDEHEIYRGRLLYTLHNRNDNLLSLQQHFSDEGDEEELS